MFTTMCTWLAACVHPLEFGCMVLAALLAAKCINRYWYKIPKASVWILFVWGMIAAGMLVVFFISPSLNLSRLVDFILYAYFAYLVTLALSIFPVQRVEEQRNPDSTT